MWIGDGPSAGRLVAASSVPEIPLAPLGQTTQHSAMAPGKEQLPDPAAAWFRRHTALGWADEPPSKPAGWKSRGHKID